MRKYAIVLLSALCIPFSASVKLQAQAGLPEPPGPRQAVLPIRISVGHSGLPAVPSVAGIFPRLSGAKQESLGAPLEGSPAAPLWLAMVHPGANEAVGPPAALLEEAERDSVAALYRQIYELVLQERWPEAHVMLSRFLQEHPDSRWADDAAFWRCYTLQKLGKPLEEVFSCYEKFVATYTDSRWRDDAKAAMIRIGEQLVRQGKKGYEEKVAALKSSDDEEVMLTALYALGQRGEAKAAEAAIRLFRRTNDTKKRLKILAVLGQFIQKQKLVPFLEEVAKSDRSEPVRIRAVDLLSRIRSADATDALLRLARQAVSPKVRYGAVFGLRRRKERTVLDALERTALEDTSADVASAAAEVLADFRDPALLPRLVRIAKEGKHLQARVRAIAGMGRIRDGKAVDALIALATGARDRVIRRAALQALQENRSPKILKAVRDIVRSGDPELEKMALMLAARIPQTEAKKLLLEYALQNGDRDLAVVAAQALTYRKKPLSRDDLLQILRKTKFERVKRSILIGLRHLPVRDQLAVVRYILQHESSAEVRKQAIWSLGRTASPELIRLLTDVAERDPHVEVRVAAVQVLARIKDSRAQEALIRIIEKQR